MKKAEDMRPGKRIKFSSSAGKFAAYFVGPLQRLILNSYGGKVKLSKRKPRLTNKDNVSEHGDNMYVC